MGHLKEACPYTVRKNKVSVDMAATSPVENDGSCNGHEECRTELPSTLTDKSTSGTSVVEEASCQYGPWMVVTRKKGAARGKKQNPSMAGTTKSDGKFANQFPSKNLRVEQTKVGFNMKHVAASNSSMGFGPHLNSDTKGKPNAAFVGKPEPLPELALNKKENSHLVRGKKKIARNFPSGILPGCAVKNPFQGLSSKLTSLSASASKNANHGSEASPCDTFMFMATIDDGVGTINDWEGEQKFSGEQSRDQSRGHVHDEVVHLEGEESLGFEVGGVGNSASLHSRNGSSDESGEEDKMVSEEGGDAKSSF